MEAQGREGEGVQVGEHVEDVLVEGVQRVEEAHAAVGHGREDRAEGDDGAEGEAEDRAKVRDTEGVIP